MPHIAYIPKSTPSGRGTTVSSAPTRKRPSALFGLWCLTAVFESATADAETDGKCHRGKDVSPRQEPDALRFEREITVFPALAQTYTKHDDTCTLEACLGESVGFMESSGSGTELITQSRLCPPEEDLKDFLSSKKTFKSGEGKAGSIDNIGASRYLAYGRLL